MLNCCQKQVKLKVHTYIYTDEPQTREMLNILRKYTNSSSIELMI